MGSKKLCIELHRNNKINIPTHLKNREFAQRDIVNFLLFTDFVI